MSDSRLRTRRFTASARWSLSTGAISVRTLFSMAASLVGLRGEPGRWRVYGITVTERLLPPGYRRGPSAEGWAMMPPTYVDRRPEVVLNTLARALLRGVIAGLAVAALACSASPSDPLGATFTREEAISAEKLGAELAARAGTSAARDVAYLVAGALITNCDEGQRDGLIRTPSERACLAALTLDDGWRAQVTTILDTPTAISEPGHLFVLLLAAALFVFCPLAADRAVRITGWRLRHFTSGAWYRLWAPLRYVVALAAALLILAIAVGVMLWVDVGAPWTWWAQWPHYEALAHRQLQVLLGLTVLLALSKAWTLGDIAQRLRGLLIEGRRRPLTPGPVVPLLPRPTPKNILICCDGTGNRAQATEEGRRAVSNVRKLYEVALSAAESGWTQDKWYDDGVGTRTSGESRRLSMLEKAANWLAANTPARVLGVLGKGRMVFELGFGIGITENIAQAYTQIVRVYHPGDRLFIVGFSRGAYTARCVADVIDDIGLLRSEHVRYAADLIQLYRYRTSTTTAVPVRPELLHDKATVAIEFLGLWDTVASLGVPLWGWSFSIGKLWSNAGFGASDITHCRFIRHALSMDEQRSQFFPTLFEEPRSAARPEMLDGRPRLEQRWFRGSHAGVGGGYADTSLSDLALAWMLEEAQGAGLQLHPDWQSSVLASTDQTFAPNPLGDVISQLDRQRIWRFGGAWPRWHPCSLTGSEGFGRLAPTVMSRAAHARSLRQAQAPVASDELLMLSPGETATIVMRGDLGWNRTGVVFEQGAIYRVTYVGGQWQDKEDPVCGPAGQRATGLGIRRFLGWGKRVVDGEWMELIGHVAHPRPWEQREQGGWKLLYYLLFADPKELTDSLIPLGRHLARIGDSVDVRMEAPSGVLWGYANDWWLFYDNNSGDVTLSVTRLADGHDADRPRYVVTAPAGFVVSQAEIRARPANSASGTLESGPRVRQPRRAPLFSVCGIR